jgi:hypothetical protein
MLYNVFKFSMFMRGNEYLVGVLPFRAREALGGADRDRTDDLRLAKPALSQLSYSPEIIEGRPSGAARAVQGGPRVGRALRGPGQI